MHWLSRLFKRKTSAEQLRELLDEACSNRQHEVADVIDHIDQALQSDKLTDDEEGFLARSSSQILNGDCSTIYTWEDLGPSIKALWQPLAREQDVYYDLQDVSRASHQTPKPNKREWALALTDEFIKSTCGIDRKLQGRILEALHAIASAPVSPRGDTIKALTGDLAGLWRFRLGDFRLIYKPDEPTMRIYLLSFGGRGAIYH